MNFKDLENYFDTLPDRVLDDASEIVAETAVEYFKGSFSDERKGFDGVRWKDLKKPKKTGSLMVESGNLLNSINPKLVTRERVVISAGNEKVNYAKVHNEGFNGVVNIAEHLRKGKIVKAHTRKVDITKRQFMGKATELAEKIHERLEEYLKSTAKPK